MYRFVLVLALIPALFASIKAQSQEPPAPDPAEVNDWKPGIESQLSPFAGLDFPVGSLSLEGATNSFFGTGAGAQNTTGALNSFVGSSAGYSNTTGGLNSFFGSGSGYSNTSGSNNSFFGLGSGYYNTTAYNNSFFGYGSGNHNTTGTANSFFGTIAGYQNTTGDYNSFFGLESGYSNTTGFHNSLFGFQSGYYNTDGWANAFFGMYAGRGNTRGSDNSFFGVAAGSSNTVEVYNTCIGFQADIIPGPDPAHAPVENATAIGTRAQVAQSNSLVLGSIAGLNYATSYVNVGIGTTTPARQLHLAGPNAVFRMDRPSDTAAFIMVRTDPTGVTPWKTFVVGTNATGVDQGEFIINDIGTAVGGAGNRRMTITNEGNVTFNGNVYAASFAPTSSLAFKTNIRTFENALETVNRLRGVRFDWKDSGKPAVGLIAEEVEEVVPEVVALENGKARGVNYDNLVAVLVEAVKEQQKQNQDQRAELESLRARLVRLEALLQAR